MKELGEIFAVRVLAFSAMSNHMHLALQFDPEWVEARTDREVAERWNQLYQRVDLNEAQQEERSVWGHRWSTCGMRAQARDRSNCRSPREDSGINVELRAE